MRKKTWLIHAQAECRDCGAQFTLYTNAQALAAQHARKYGHTVEGEVGLAFRYGEEKESGEEWQLANP